MQNALKLLKYIYIVPPPPPYRNISQQHPSSSAEVLPAQCFFSSLSAFRRETWLSQHTHMLMQGISMLWF